MVDQGKAHIETNGPFDHDDNKKAVQATKRVKKAERALKLAESFKRKQGTADAEPQIAMKAKAMKAMKVNKETKAMKAKAKTTAMMKKPAVAKEASDNAAAQSARPQGRTSSVIDAQMLAVKTKLWRLCGPAGEAPADLQKVTVRDWEELRE